MLRCLDFSSIWQQKGVAGSSGGSSRWQQCQQLQPHAAVADKSQHLQPQLRTTEPLSRTATLTPSRVSLLFLAPVLLQGTKMPSIAYYRNYGKTFKKPRRPFEKERLDAELKVVGEFGLRNKRELWRVQMVLSKLRARARDLLTLDEKDPK